jgi:hypothetical protein
MTPFTPKNFIRKLHKKIAYLRHAPQYGMQRKQKIQIAIENVGNLKMAVFGDVLRCSLVESGLRCRVTYCLVAPVM